MLFEFVPVLAYGKKTTNRGQPEDANISKPAQLTLFGFAPRE